MPTPILRTFGFGPTQCAVRLHRETATVCTNLTPNPKFTPAPFDSAEALSDPERGWPLRRFVLGDFHSGDRCSGGPDPEPIDESVNLRRCAAGQDLDAAVGEIAGVPGDPELAGPQLRAATIENALNSPAHPADSAYHRRVLVSKAFTRPGSCAISAPGCHRRPLARSGFATRSTSAR
jgi:hypothetical protein